MNRTSGLWVLALIAMLCRPGTPLAQDAAGYACNLDGVSLNAGQLLDRTLNWRHGMNLPPPLVLPARYSSRQAGVPETVLVLLGKGGIGPDWARANFIGAGQSREEVESYTINLPGEEPSVGRRHAREALRVSVQARSDIAELLVEVPMNRTNRFGEQWDLVVGVCHADTDALLGYGIVAVPISPFGLTALLSISAFLIGWLILALVAWKLNAQRLQHAWLKTFENDLAAHEVEHAKPPVHPFAEWSWLGDRMTFARLRWKLLRAIDPVFIAQDALGCGSLSRLQLFLFSMAVAAVVTYIFLRVGNLPSFSEDVLLLLGISAGSNALSRIVGTEQKLSSAGHRLIFGLGFVKRASSMPRFADLVKGQGEIDVTRVQALLFTLIVIGALVANGTRDLSAFSIPQEMTFLLGLSQGIYILGKLIPSEITSRLNAQIEALMTAAAAARSTKEPRDPAATIAFENAKRALSASLEEIYGEHFRKEEFDRLPPEQAV